MTTEPFQLYQNPGWGSAIVELQLAYYGLPVRLISADDLYDDPQAQVALARVNPVMQVPTLRLPDGGVMTESAAITLHLADLTGSDALVPGPMAPERAAFLRWLVYLVAQIYPTFAFGDAPERYLPANPQALQDAMIARRKDLWRIFADAAAKDGPWFLGPRLSAIDLYLACMVHWRPRQDWFAAEAPRLLSIAETASDLPVLRATMARNFEQG